MTLDNLHHIAITVNDIAEGVNWYSQRFNCQIIYQDATWALLRFGNMDLAMVLPNSHPPHIGFACDHPEQYGTPIEHRDGTTSVYIPDPFGNYIEMIKLEK